MVGFWFDDNIIMNQDTFIEKLKNETYTRIAKDVGKPNKAVITIKDTDKLHIPHGDKNYIRINNINDADMLVHIQQHLVHSNRCIIDILTSSSSNECQKINDNIRKKVHEYSISKIDDDWKNMYPQYIDESDEDYLDRLCHIIMHHECPQKLKMIYCNECICNWLNSSKW